MKYFGVGLVLLGLGVLSAPRLLAQEGPSSAGTQDGPLATLKKDIKILVLAKISDPVIIGYIRHNARPGEPPTTQDLVELKQAGASEAVLKALVEATAT